MPQVELDRTVNNKQWSVYCAVVLFGITVTLNEDLTFYRLQTPFWLKCYIEIILYCHVSDVVAFLGRSSVQCSVLFFLTMHIRMSCNHVAHAQCLNNLTGHLWRIEIINKLSAHQTKTSVPFKHTSFAAFCSNKIVQADIAIRLIVQCY